MNQSKRRDFGMNRVMGLAQKVRTYDCALDLEPEALPPDLPPPVILKDVVRLEVFGNGFVILVEVMERVGLCRGWQ
jgi:hypothetical protein